jgi:hypothetical protein
VCSPAVPLASFPQPLHPPKKDFSNAIRPHEALGDVPPYQYASKQQ